MREDKVSQADPAVCVGDVIFVKLGGQSLYGGEKCRTKFIAVFHIGKVFKQEGKVKSLNVFRLAHNWSVSMSSEQQI